MSVNPYKIIIDLQFELKIVLFSEVVHLFFLFNGI